MPNHVVLFQPEIPANTGNIARTCLATDTTLHLIHPLGFSTEDRMVKRAGLDYWYDVTIYHYDSLKELYEKFPEGEYYYVENFGGTSYIEMDYTDTSKDQLFIFGRESDGIPHELLEGMEDRCVRIPMTDKVRSLNLANTVSIMLFHALHEQGFPGLIK